jgi:hypothetical protein
VYGEADLIVHFISRINVDYEYKAQPLPSITFNILINLPQSQKINCKID